MEAQSAPRCSQNETQQRTSKRTNAKAARCPRLCPHALLHPANAGPSEHEGPHGEPLHNCKSSGSHVKMSRKEQVKLTW